MQEPYQRAHTAALGETRDMFDFLRCDCVAFRCIYCKHIAHDKNKTAFFTWEEKQSVSGMCMCRALGVRCLPAARAQPSLSLLPVQEGVEVRVARIFNTFGPRMHMNDGRVVSNFILQALQGEPLTVGAASGAECVLVQGHVPEAAAWGFCMSLHPGDWEGRRGHRIRERDGQCQLGGLAFQACREHRAWTAGVVHTAQAVCLLCRPACKHLPDVCSSHWPQPGCVCAQGPLRWPRNRHLSGWFGHPGSFESGATWWVGVSGPSVWPGRGPLLRALRHPLSLLGQECAG